MNNSLNNTSKWQQMTLIGFCCLIFVYVLIRALYVPFTFDEVTTSQIVEGDIWKDFGISANNHLLNTVMVKGLLEFFDPSVFIYRTPSVLVFGLFLFFTVKIGKLLSPEKPFLVTVFLVSMPFLLDFFSLSRGYGLSISFLVISVYYTLKYAHQSKMYQLLGSLIFGMLSVLSNYTALHFFLPQLFVLLLFILKNKEKRIQSLIIYVTITALFFSFLLPILFQLKDGHHLIFGGRDNFYKSVVLSLGRSFGYGILNIKVSEVIFVILFIVALIFSVKQFFLIIKNKRLTPKDVLPIIFVLTILSPISQHILLETFYPAERTALLYYPLMIFIVIDGLGTNLTKLKSSILNILSLGIITVLILSINISYTYSWKYESGTMDMLKHLKSLSKSNENNVKLGIDYIFSPPTMYYRGKMDFSNLETVEIFPCCWEFEMGIEELNPKYYGAGQYSKQHMSMEDINRVFTDDFDYFYINGYTIGELKRNKVKYNIIWSSQIANSYLIKF